jgi:Glutamate-1-semialdehyde aminotransferase
MASALSAAGVAHRIVGAPALFEPVFAEAPVRTYRDVIAQDAPASAAFAKALRARGVLKPPGKVYPCLALTEDDLGLVEAATAAAAEALVLAKP